MDIWTIAVIITLLCAMGVYLTHERIAQAIARLINAPREAAMLRMMEEALKEKASWDDWQHSLQHQKSDDFHHMDEALRTMANAGRISLPGTPSYEIVMHDDWQSDTEEELTMSNHDSQSGKAERV